MAKGIIVFDRIPECCATPDGMVKCPFAWNTQFCSRFSPKGLDMTNGEWEEIYMQGIKPDWCPIKPIPQLKPPDKLTPSPMVQNYYTTYDQGWNDCIKEIEGETK